MAFQFPAAPTSLETVVNPITGSTYQWRDDLNKWILTRQTAEISDSKNDQQDASINELSGRIDAIGAVVGVLDFKGRYKYVIERTSETCDAAYGRCLIDADSSTDPAGARIECNRLYTECSLLVGQPYDAGTFTSKGTTNVMSAVDEFIFSGADLDGQAFDWINIVEPTDYIEFIEKVNGDTSLYECIEEPKVSSTERSVRVKFLKETGDGDGNFNLQEEYDIRVIKASNGINIIEADERYVKKPVVNAALVDIEALKAKPDITSSTTAPVNPKQGDLWFNPSTLKFAFYTSGAWINPDKS